MNKKYAKEYVLTVVHGKKRLVYTGPFFRVEMPEKQFIREKRWAAVNGGWMAGLFVCMGLVGNECTRQVYVGLPYAFLVIPAVYGVVDAIRFAFLRGDMERIHYEGILIHMLGWHVAAMLMSALSGGGAIGYMIIKVDFRWGGILFVLLGLLLSLSAFIGLRRLRQLKNKIREIPPPPSV